MASGSKRFRGNDEYVFIDSRAMKAEGAVHIDLDDAASALRNDAATVVPGQEALAAHRASKQKSMAGAADGPQATAYDKLMLDDRRATRRKCLGFGIALLVLICVSACISNSYYFTIYSPGDVLACYGSWFQLTMTSVTDASRYAQMQYSTVNALPMYNDVISQVPEMVKYLVAGILLAISGMLYQNTFRNPIAAPSMLGVSNGINVALLILVIQFDVGATAMIGNYYLYTYIGGIIVLLLVFAGGKLLSSDRSFNVVNMLLAGTILSQVIGVITTYAQNTLLTDAGWEAFYRLQTAAADETIWTFITLFIGALVALVPVFVFRFKLNLVSFSDEETRLLGVNPNRLRILALACGSIMILTAQVNTGQVAMASLIVPFVARAVFGAEFRKQLLGNILIGAILILLCGDIANIVNINGAPIDLGSIVTIIALPLFVWMITVRQRGWE